MDNLEALDVDQNFEPQTRARSNTWPLPRPEYFVDKDEDKVVVPATIQEGQGIDSVSGLHADGVGQPPKKNSSRRNAWGNKSYADLITQAITSAPEKRLTLSQIYDWMVQNVAYFKDKGDSNSSAGWKNSIRHNLSLHNRFMRVQNEGTGKSSWWMVNPDAKPGKAARRRAVSMETQKYEKKRGRVKKKVDNLRNNVEATPSPSSSVSEGIDMFPESPVHPQSFQLSPDFRPRASSNASSCSRLSPIPAIENDGQDSQVPPLSPIPWNTESRPRASTGGQLKTLFRPTPTKNNNVLHASTGTLGGDRYGADQLVESLTEAMKLDESVFMTSKSNGGHLTSINGNGGYSLNGSNACFTRFARRGINGGNGALPVANDFGSPYQTGSARNSPGLISVQSPGQPSPQGMDSGNGSFLSSVSPQHSVSPGLENMVVSRQSGNVFGGASFHDAPSPNVVAIPVSPETAMIQQQSATLKATLYGPAFSRELSPSASTSLGSTAQLMGHLFSLNNPLPNDVDLNTIQEGLECDVDQVIRHELSVDGNLDFNFEHQNAAAAANSVSHPTTMASSVVNRPWVH